MKKIFTVFVAAAATLNVFGQSEGFVEIGGVEYRTVVMKDGREWMAENLRYVPEGKTITPLNDWTAENNTGVWYPAEFSISESDNAVITPTDSEESIKKMGLLYSMDVVMGGEELPGTDFADAANLQGIAPKGWHIPTAQEWLDLVGACAETDHNNTSAPYYNESLSGADLKALNDDGMNLLPYPFVNDGESYLGNYGNKDNTRDYYGYASMAYFASSTSHSATQNYCAMITNNAAKTSVNVAYNNLTNGIFVRFIKDKTSTGITQIETGDSKNDNAAAYNLVGQRVNRNAKGIIIKNGKKYVK